MKLVAAARPELDEYGGPFANYVALVPEERILEVLENQLGELLAVLRPLDEAEALTLHAPYTWTIKEVVGHVTDCERIFAYRALRAARGDATPLAGFDENEYARHAHFSTYQHRELVSELEHVRQASLWLFRHLDDAAWLRRGTAAGVVLSVRAWAYIITGHARHHLTILRRRLRQ